MARITQEEFEEWYGETSSRLSYGMKVSDHLRVRLLTEIGLTVKIFSGSYEDTDMYLMYRLADEGEARGVVERAETERKRLCAMRSLLQKNTCEGD